MSELTEILVWKTDWYWNATHSVNVITISVNHLTGQIFLYQLKSTSLPTSGDQGDGLWAREHHQPLCFEAENLSISRYPEHPPQIGCRRLQKQEWWKSAGDGDTERMRQTQAVVCAGQGSCPRPLPWSIPGTPHHPKGVPEEVESWPVHPPAAQHWLTERPQAQ